MAKFCANCGSQMRDEDKICGQCGTPVVNIQENISSLKKDNHKNKLPKLIISIIVILAVLVILIIIGGGGSYKRVANKMIKAIENNDANALISISSYIDKTLYGDDLQKEYTRFISDMINKDNIGTLKTISCEITNTTKVSEKELGTFKSSMVFLLGLYVEMSEEEIEEEIDKEIELLSSKVNSITEMTTVDLKLTVKGTEGSEIYTKENIYLLKEKDGWKFSEFLTHLEESE